MCDLIGLISQFQNVERPKKCIGLQTVRVWTSPQTLETRVIATSPRQTLVRPKKRRKNSPMNAAIVFVC